MHFLSSLSTYRHQPQLFQCEMQQQSYPGLILFTISCTEDLFHCRAKNSTFFSFKKFTTSVWHICIDSITILALWAIVMYNKGSLNATLWDLITRMGTKQVLSWKKGWVTPWVGQSEMVWDFFSLLWMACHLKLMDFFFKFLELSTWYLWTTVGGREEIREKRETTV